MTSGLKKSKFSGCNTAGDVKRVSTCQMNYGRDQQGWPQSSDNYTSIVSPTDEKGMIKNTYTPIKKAPEIKTGLRPIWSMKITVGMVDKNVL